MKRFFISFFLIAILSSASFSQPIIKKSQKAFPSSFAIFVDSQTFQKIGKSIDAYKNAVEADGISTNIVIENWKNPNEIRKIIIDLYQKKPPLEGVVFVGDIPIPMIRDAQHLTSAFKMDQQGHFSWQRSSVPSDRFYEDFDLNFKYLKQDSSNQLLFYYSLRFDSPQFFHLPLMRQSMG